MTDEEKPKLGSKQQRLILLVMQDMKLDKRLTPTSGEVIDVIDRMPGQSATNTNAWRARFSELRDRGVIVEAGERPCRVSGRLSVVWAITGRADPLPPRDPRKRKPTAAEWRKVARKLAVQVSSFGKRATTSLAMDQYRDLEKLA